MTTESAWGGRGPEIDFVLFVHHPADSGLMQIYKTHEMRELVAMNICYSQRILGQNWSLTWDERIHCHDPLVSPSLCD